MMIFRCVAKCDFCPGGIEQSFHRSVSDFKNDMKKSGWKFLKSKKVKCGSCSQIDLEIKDRIACSGISKIIRIKKPVIHQVSLIKRIKTLSDDLGNF